MIEIPTYPPAPKTAQKAPKRGIKVFAPRIPARPEEVKIRKKPRGWDRRDVSFY